MLEDVDAISDKGGHISKGAKWNNFGRMVKYLRWSRLLLQSLETSVFLIIMSLQSRFRRNPSWSETEMVE